MSKKKKDLFDPSKVEKLNIPEDEIWTYRIEGLQKPRITDRTVSPAVKAGIIVVLIVSISLSLFMSIRAVSNKEYKYADTGSGIELVKYTNVDGKKEVNVDFADGDPLKPVTEIHEYAFNCDETIETVNIGRDVRLIDGKSFFSCRALRCIFVDDDNPFYCDIDGVLYSRDCTELICCPISHCFYLTEKAGVKLSFPADGSIIADDFRNAVKLIKDCRADSTLISERDGGGLIKKFTALTGVTDFEAFLSLYEKEVSCYRIPETVTSVEKLAFAYSDLYSVELPESVVSIGNMAFFRMDYLCSVNTYADGGICPSLPNGLRFIGADCFSFDRELTYMFIPASVEKIGHHAFYNTCWKDGGELRGLSQINAEADEKDFSRNTETGENWLPKFDSGLFKKSVDVVYGSERKNP